MSIISFPKYTTKEWIVNLNKLVFILGIIILPHIYWPYGGIMYEVPKTVFFNRWVEVFVVFSIINLFLNSKRARGNTDKILFLSLLLFTIVAFTSSFLGPDIIKSVLGNYYRGHGLFTFLHLVSLSISLSLVWDKSWNKVVAYSYLMSFLLLSTRVLIGGYKFHALDNRSITKWSDGAIGLTFGQPNFLAGYLVVSMPFTAYLLSKTKKTINRVALVFGLVVQILAVTLTKSEAGVVGVGLILLGSLVIMSRGVVRKLTIVGFLAMLLLGTFMIIIQNRYTQDPLASITVKAGSRERIFTKGLLAVKQKPILGWGWSNFDYAFESTDWPIKFNDDVYVDKAHSNFLEVLTTTGVVGFSVYILIILKTGYLLRKGNTRFHKFMLLTLIIFVIHSQTNIISVAEEAIFWVIVGVALTINTKSLRN